jgi:hypothetical protein
LEYLSQDIQTKLSLLQYNLGHHLDLLGPYHQYHHWLPFLQYLQHQRLRHHHLSRGMDRPPVLLTVKFRHKSRDHHLAYWNRRLRRRLRLRRLRRPIPFLQVHLDLRDLQHLQHLLGFV